MMKRAKKSDEEMIAEINAMDLPRSRARADEIDGIIYLHVLEAQFEKSTAAIERRLKSIPGGWRDAKMLFGVVRRLNFKLCNTLLKEKQKTVEDMLPNVQYLIRYRHHIGADDKGISGIYTDDLDVIVNKARESCLMCDKNCNACALGKAFDRLTYTSRAKDESYSFGGFPRGDGS